jgi:hypothetical protein
VGGYDIESKGNFSIKVVSGLVNLDEENSTTPLTLFPNPAEDQITVKSDALDVNQHTFCSIYTLTGQRVQIEPINANLFNIDISHLQDGMYIVELHTTSKLLSRTPLIVK